jgi:predicted DNA-binding protein (MmcQ/YjbR family)
MCGQRPESRLELLMAKKPGALDRMREICLALPDTKETLTWGKPHFRVGEKIFAGFGEENGKAVIGFKLTMSHAHSIIENPRFWPAPYVGHDGWVSMDTTSVDDWVQVRELVLESYRLIAPKRTVKLLDAAQLAAEPKSKTPKKAAAPAMAAARKKAAAARKTTVRKKMVATTKSTRARRRRTPK